jgi:hypothetical protein
VLEYLAKPWLEARQEAILDGQRLTRSVAAKLALVDHLFTKLFACCAQDAPMQSFEDPETTKARIVATIDPVMEAVASGQLRTTKTAQHALMAHIAILEFWRDDFGGDERGNAENALEFCRLAAGALATPRWKRRALEAIDRSLRQRGWHLNKRIPGRPGRPGSDRRCEAGFAVAPTPRKRAGLSLGGEDWLGAARLRELVPPPAWHARL